LKAWGKSDRLLEISYLPAEGEAFLVCLVRGKNSEDLAWSQVRELAIAPSQVFKGVLHVVQFKVEGWR
jgi:hypothetical protein